MAEERLRLRHGGHKKWARDMRRFKGKMEDKDTREQYHEMIREKNKLKDRQRKTNTAAESESDSSGSSDEDEVRKKPSEKSRRKLVILNNQSSHPLTKMMRSKWISRRKRPRLRRRMSQLEL